MSILDFKYRYGRQTKDNSFPRNQPTIPSNVQVGAGTESRRNASGSAGVDKEGRAQRAEKLQDAPAEHCQRAL